MSIISVVLLVLFGILIGYAVWYKSIKKKSENKGGGSSSGNQSTKPIKKRRQ